MDVYNENLEKRNTERDSLEAGYLPYDDSEGEDSETDFHHMFAVHPIHRVWWALLTGRKNLAQYMIKGVNVTAGAMLLSRSGFAELAVRHKTFLDVYMALTYDVSSRIFRRLGNLHTVDRNFESQVLPAFPPAVGGSHSSLCGAPATNNEALLEALLFAGLPKGKGGVCLVETLGAVSGYRDGQSRIGSMPFLVSLAHAPAEAQESEILDRIIDFIWGHTLKYVYYFEFFLFGVYCFAQMVLLDPAFATTSNPGGGVTGVEGEAEWSTALVVDAWLVLILNSYFFARELLQMALIDDYRVPDMWFLGCFYPLVLLRKLQVYLSETTNGKFGTCPPALHARTQRTS